jgi:hypothetical protein
MVSKLILFLGLAIQVALGEVEFKHHNNTEMAAVMQQVSFLRISILAENILDTFSLEYWTRFHTRILDKFSS